MKKEEIKAELKARGIQFNEDAPFTELSSLLKSVVEKENAAKKPEEPLNQPVNSGKIEINKEEWENVQKQLKMLYDVADKGRLYNYESKTAEKKPLKVRLSVYQEKIIIGWQTKRDELIKDVRTGVTVGEKQEIEVKLLDDADQIHTVLFDGYAAFSNARYNNRVEAEVINRKEDYQGNISFDVRLPNGRTISLDARFVN